MKSKFNIFKFNGLNKNKTIKQYKRNKKVIIFVGLIILIAIIMFFKHHNKVKTDANKKAVVTADSALILNQSDIVTVGHGDVESAIAFTGDLLPLTKVIISSEVDEEVKQVLVKEGQLVQKGQLLAILDDTDLVQNVSEARAQLATAKSQFELDKIKLERNEDLYKQGFISKNMYDELKNTYQGSLQNINQKQATLQRLQKQLSNARVRAPFSGYIYQKSIDPGKFANKGNQLFALANLDAMQITAAISSDQINMIQPNQPVSFKVESSEKVYSGKVTRVNPVAEAGTRSYMIYIDFNNTVYKLRAGQFVKGQLVVKGISNVDYVASTAVRKDALGTYVLALENGVVVKKPVKVLLTNSVTEISAISGLKLNDNILSGNVLTAKAGDKIKIMN